MNGTLLIASMIATTVALVLWLAVTGALMLAVGIFAVLACGLALLYYDFRYRKHWTGFTFGYPLQGFDKRIFFTFDDGPSRYGKILCEDDDAEPINDPLVREVILRELPDYDFAKSATENLLDLLKTHNVKGVFFLWGDSIKKQPEAPAIIRRLIDDGHIIGNHSLSHLYSRREPTPRILQDFAENHDVIKSVADTEPTVFRPPCGDWEPELTKKFLQHPKLKDYSFPIFWTDLFKEWALHSVEELDGIDQRLKAFRRSCIDGPGKVLLLHDVYIPAILLTSMLIKEVKQLGYTIGDPRELSAAADAETNRYRNSPFRYYLSNLGKRLSAKLTRTPLKHTNYRMES